MRRQIKKMEIKQMDTIRSQRKIKKDKSNFDWLVLRTVTIYWLLTYLIFFVFFGYTTNDVYAGAYIGSSYYMTCALICVFVMIYLAFTTEKITLAQKLTALVLLIVTIDNVIMSIDAAVNTYNNKYFYFIDEIIQGNPDWLIPFGLSDIILTLILVICLTYSFFSQE